MRRPLTIVILVVLTFFDDSFGVDFEWRVLKLGDCTPNNASLGLCTKSRVVNCVQKTNGQPIPEYYCVNSSRISKPSSYVSCDVKECSQHCVVSTWSMWHACDVACSVPFRYRTRSILWKDQTSATCPTLIEKASCARCASSANQDFYLWQVTKWGTCRRFKIIPVYQLDVNISQSTVDVTASSRACGPSLTLAKSTRKVRCVDRSGKEVRARKCLNGRDKQGRITQRPEKTKVCQLSCDCNLSSWSDWSGCPKDCSATEERRTRDVLYAPKLSGKQCGTLEETRACSTGGCPRYEWYGTPWRACQTHNNPGSLKKAQCGNGLQERLVFCIKSSGKKSMREIQPVEDNRCDYTIKLVSKQPCHTPCPDDCKVSEWHEWEACSTSSCGKAGVKERKRTILQDARNGGSECPNLVELSPCGQQKCVSWYISTWSICFLPGFCGSTGQNTRLIYCRGITGVWTSRTLCGKAPAIKKNCSIPCPNDCVLSDWSNWGSCSKSCGAEGGIKTRYRRIVAYPSIHRRPCPAAKELVESQKCNQYTFCEKEVNFKWKMEPWSQCHLPANGTCGVKKGGRTRTVHCGTHMQNFSNSSYCPQALKPADVQPCDIPCPRDCIVSKWQEWSKCNETCGVGGVQIRMRYILQKPSNGGVECPPNMTNGVQRVVKPCVPRPPCYTYTWNVTEWDRCVLFSPSKPAQVTCGAGYQTRNVSCLRSDQKLVQPSLCYKSLLMPTPSTLKQCWKPCADYCVRSSWTPWSSCPHHCDPNAPRYRQRTRQVVNLSPARGGWSTTCPHLTAIDFSQTENCPTLSCYSYKWHAGAWESWVPNRISSNCGYGQKERNILCQRSDQVYVSDTYCSKVMKPVCWKTSFKDCSEDCIVSSWGQWTKFSNSCGDSIQKRSRTVLKSPIGLGKACPSLTENQLYHDIPCLSFKWSSDLWSTCKLSSNNSICGKGTQTRQVVCFPNATREENCLRQAPKPASMQSCYLPCPGDCVWSRAGDWSNCVRAAQSCMQNQWRRILRKASTTSTKQCDGKIEQETRSCDCPQAGQLVASEWSTCQLNRTNGPNCGKGVQFRSVKCVGKNGEVVNDALCPTKDALAISEDCHVKCPVDCILGLWSMWSVCSKDCGLDGVIMRSRNIIVPGKNGGRKCPEQSSLVEKRPCNGKPCYTYKLQEGKWSKCNVDGGGCGYGTKTREALCRRSDGQPVNLYYCFGQLKSFGNGAYSRNLNILQALLNNVSKLSISTRQSCIEACPGNCRLSEWSDWSQCGKTCFQTTTQTFQSRSRVIISKPIVGGKACSTELLQTRSCQSRGSNQCIGAEWKTGTWQTNGTRAIWCETSIGINVTGACVMEKMPLKTKLCDPVCPDGNAMCTDGKCVCKERFERFQNQCIPHQGCLHDAHCRFQNNVCKSQKCECKDGYVRNTTTGLCVQTNGSPTSASTRTVTVNTQAKTEATTAAKSETTVESFLQTSKAFTVHTSPAIHLISSSSPSSTATSSDGPDKKALDDGGDDDVLQGYWKWVGIGAGALLFFILLIVGVFCYTRRQKKSISESKHKEKANAIELVGILSLNDGEKTLLAKV